MLPTIGEESSPRILEILLLTELRHWKILLLQFPSVDFSVFWEICQLYLPHNQFCFQPSSFYHFSLAIQFCVIKCLNYWVFSIFFGPFCGSVIFWNPSYWIQHYLCPFCDHLLQIFILILPCVPFVFLKKTKVTWCSLCLWTDKWGYGWLS